MSYNKSYAKAIRNSSNGGKDEFEGHMNPRNHFLSTFITIVTRIKVASINYHYAIIEFRSSNRDKCRKHVNKQESIVL